MQQAAFLVFLLLASRVQAAAAVVHQGAAANFTTPMVFLPWATTFSVSAEVQVVLATIPLLLLGFVGLALVSFQFSMGRFSRLFLDLSIAVGAAFLAGLLELFNVLRCELTHSSTMSYPLLRAQGLATATFITFLLLFLFRKTRYPLHRETPSLVRLPDFKTDPAGNEKRMSDISFEPPSMSNVIHSASYERYGIPGSLAKAVVFLMIITVGILEAVWRLGFLSSTSGFESFSGAYRASNAIQIALFVFFYSKLLDSARIADAAPLSRNFTEIAPALFGLILLFSVAVLNLIPKLIGFSDAPLGRFLTMVAVYTFLLTLTIQDHASPIRDSLSFDLPSRIVSSLPLPRRATATRLPPLTRESVLDLDTDVRRNLNRANQTPTPTLPERIVVRRSSTIPSWLPNRQPSLKRADAPRESEKPVESATAHSSAYPGSLVEQYEDPNFDRLLQLQRDSLDATLRTSSRYSKTIGGESNPFEGPMPPIPESPEVPRNLHRRQFSSATVKSKAPSRHESTLQAEPTVGLYDASGNRMSSPNLDLSFSAYNSVSLPSAETSEAAEEAQRYVFPRPAPPPPPL